MFRYAIRFGVASVLALAALAVFSQVGETEDPLRYRLQEDDTFAYRIKAKLDVTVDSPGGKMKNKREYDLIFEQRTAEVDPDTGNAVIETSIKKFDVAFSADEAPQEALDEYNKELRELAKRMLNKPFKITMTPRGEIKKVEAKEFLAAQSMDDDKGPAFFSKENMKQGLAAPGLVYPKKDEPIWAVESELVVDPFGKIEQKLNWSRQGEETVKKIPSHILELSGTGKFADEGATLQFGQETVNVSLTEFETEAVAHVSQEDRWPVKLKKTTDMVITFTGSHTETMTIKRTMAVERLRPDEY